MDHQFYPWDRPQRGGKTFYVRRAKSGVNGMMKSVARELGEYNVQVNVANPGRTIRPGEIEERRQVEENVLKRTHKDASQTANFFVCLSEMKDVSGQVFNLDSRILF